MYTSADVSWLICSQAVSEAAHHYAKLKEAMDKLAHAKAEKDKHEMHFMTFPAMRERYEGSLAKAEDELRKAQESWKKSSMVADELLSASLKPKIPARELEEISKRVAVEVVYNDLGIRKFVDDRIALQVPLGFAELREEMAKLKENDARREHEVKELSAYCKSSLLKLETNYKAVETKQSFLNISFEQIRSGMPDLKKDVENAQQLALHASDAMEKLDGLKARVDQVQKSNR